MVFPLDKIKKGVTVSRWDKEGRLYVGSGYRSLKRLFTDAGYSVRKREQVPVLYCDGKPIAAISVAADLSCAEGNGPWWVVSARDEKE